MNLKNWSGKTEKTSLVDGSTDLWTQSDNDSAEYYYSGDGSPLSEKPIAVYIDGEKAPEEDVGSLSQGAWGWGDKDSIDEDRLYVRISGDGDPDSEAEDYVQSIAHVDVVTVAGTKTALLFSVEICHDETSEQTLDIVRLASDGETEKLRTTYDVPANYAITPVRSAVLEADEILRLEAKFAGAQVFASGDES